MDSQEFESLRRRLSIVEARLLWVTKAAEQALERISSIEHGFGVAIQRSIMMGRDITDPPGTGLGSGSAQWSGSAPGSAGSGTITGGSGVFGGTGGASGD